MNVIDQMMETWKQVLLQLQDAKLAFSSSSFSLANNTPSSRIINVRRRRRRGFLKCIYVQVRVVLLFIIPTL